jgi:pyruvate kinase
MVKVKTNWIKLICTIGPTLVDAKILKRMEQLGVDLLRINMSHTSIKQLKEMVRLIQRITGIPICIDTEGAQIRTGRIKNDTAELRKGDLVKIISKDIIGDSACFCLTPLNVVKQLIPGTLVYIDYNRVLLLITENIKGKFVTARVVCGGTIGSNKAVNVNIKVNLPNITYKDYEAIKFAKKKNINTFALSFTRNKEAVEELRNLVGKKATIISKIETIDGIINLDEIIEISNAILIDRGDLSREVSIEQIPAFQKMIISRAHKKPIPVYVATNLLESMVSLPYPNRAEINDIANTLLDGANGLVLAAETAIGKYPLQCINMIRRLIQNYETQIYQKISFNESYPKSNLFNNTTLSSTTITSYKKNKRQPMLFVDSSTIRDIQNLTYGCYAPLTGFMNRYEIESVLDNYILPDGNIWTMPIVLLARKKDIHATIGDKLLLVSRENGKSICWLIINDIYCFNIDNIALRWFGTNNCRHPGVNRLIKGGDCFIGGQVKLIQPNPCEFSEYFLSPSQVRSIFSHYGWDQIIAFHTRNIPHRAHEYIQIQALERTGADALFIQPALGQKKSGDFTPEAIIKGYQALIGNYYPTNKVLLSGFFVDSWYCGPREAVFTALCRKNYGCSYFIVGRDHTGLGNFYKSEDVRALFEKLGDLGIQPLFFDKVVYDPITRCYKEIKSQYASSRFRDISGTEVRKYILKNRVPPKWMVRPELSSIILQMKTQGQQVLVP